MYNNNNNTNNNFKNEQKRTKFLDFLISHQIVCVNIYKDYHLTYHYQFDYFRVI